MPEFSELSALASTLTGAVLAAADPARAVRDNFPAEVDGADRLTVLVTGKASAPMVEAALEHLGPRRGRICAGAVTCVPQHGPRVLGALGPLARRVAVCPADHPLATERNLAAARAVAGAASAADEQDTVVALVSGGASAHLTLPAEGLGLEHIRDVTNALLRAGAPIEELNAVRKHLEQLKGGRLARLIHPARAHVLVLSDVLGDPLGTIGSGPTAPDPTTYADALGVLDRYGLSASHSRVAEHLRLGVGGLLAETPKPGESLFGSITHRVIANNRAAIDAAVGTLKKLGFVVHHVESGVQGEASEVGRRLVARLAGLVGPAAVVFGGETTVTVGDAAGLGGRNQELALAAAIELERLPGAAVLTLATDGADGPTDAAGAVVSSSTVGDLRGAGVDAADALGRHDSHRALDRAGALLRTGPTGTNINDIAVGMLFPR